MPQESALGPFVFQNLPDDLFFFLKNIGTCNFAATYISDKSFENVLKSFEKNSMLGIHWVENNYLKLNTGKCHLIVLGDKHEQVWANIEKDLIWENSDIKLCGIIIDRDLKFDKRVLKLCSKANQKLSTLKLSFLWSLSVNIVQLFGCFIVDIPTAKLMLQERALRIVYDDDVSTFDKLLAMEKSFCIHHQNRLGTRDSYLKFWEQFEKIIYKKRKYHKPVV